MEGNGQNSSSEHLTQKDIVQLLLHNAQHMVTREELKSDINEVKDEIVKVETSLKQDMVKLESSLKQDMVKLEQFNIKTNYLGKRQSLIPFFINNTRNHHKNSLLTGSVHYLVGLRYRSSNLRVDKTSTHKNLI
jgi:hypothetical protein